MTMKVNMDAQIAALQKVRKAHRTQAVEKTEKAQSGDKVHISTATQQAADTSRTERVQELRAQVESGTYNPDMREVAASLLRFIGQGK